MKVVTSILLIVFCLSHQITAQKNTQAVMKVTARAISGVSLKSPPLIYLQFDSVSVNKVQNELISLSGCENSEFILRVENHLTLFNSSGDSLVLDLSLLDFNKVNLTKNLFLQTSVLNTSNQDITGVYYGELKPCINYLK